VIPGTAGDGDALTTFAPLRPSVAGAGDLPFTGAASDLLAVAAAGLLAAGALFVRATRPPPRRKEVRIGNPAEAAGQQALMVTGR
jgi:hypothetical protein